MAARDRTVLVLVLGAVALLWFLRRPIVSAPAAAGFTAFGSSGLGDVDPFTGKVQA